MGDASWTDVVAEKVFTPTTVLTKKSPNLLLLLSNTLNWLPATNPWLFVNVNVDMPVAASMVDTLWMVDLGPWLIANCPVIISGGVASIEDIRKAKNLKNVEGVIVGKAIYDGDIKLEELVKEDA